MTESTTGIPTSLAGNYAFDLDHDARDAGEYPDDAYPSASTDRHGTAAAGSHRRCADNATGGSSCRAEATLVGYRIGFGAYGTLGPNSSMSSSV